MAREDVRRGSRIAAHHILPLGIKAIIARIYKAPSLLDTKECIVLDYSETSLKRIATLGASGILLLIHAGA
jgi:hypothetical protein